MVLTLFTVSAQTRQDRPQQEERDRKIEYDGTPILRAKLALETARAQVLEERYTDASAALRDAEKALNDYANFSHGPHAETAQFIREEIQAYEPKIVRIRNQQDALDRIDLWARPINRWYEASLQ